MCSFSFSFFWYFSQKKILQKKTEQLKEIETNPLVPRQLLFEALLERLKFHEQQKSAIPKDEKKDESSKSETPEETATASDARLAR